MASLLNSLDNNTTQTIRDSYIAAHDKLGSVLSRPGSGSVRPTTTSRRSHVRSQVTNDTPFGKAARGFAAGVSASAGVVGYSLGTVGVAGVLGALLWRGAPALARRLKRNSAVSAIREDSKLPGNVREVVDLIKDIVLGVYSEDDLQPTRAEDANPDGIPELDADGNCPPPPPPATKADCDPYKFDPTRTLPRRSFWIMLGCEGKAMFGPLPYTAANKRMVFVWLRRRAIEITKGSIRASHLATYLPAVTAAVFCRSARDDALEEAVNLLTAAGKITRDDAW